MVNSAHKCQSQIAHSAPENLCYQIPPLTLSLSQIIELEKEADDEPKLFTRTNKKQYKKKNFSFLSKKYKNKLLFVGLSFFGMREVWRVLSNFQPNHPIISLASFLFKKYLLLTLYIISYFNRKFIKII